MKRMIALLLSCLLLTTLAGCNSISDTPISSDITQTLSTEASSEAVSDAPEDKFINVFSTANELTVLVKKYKELHPDFPYEIRACLPSSLDGAYHITLDSLLAAGGEMIPYIYSVEDLNVPRYSKGSSAKYAVPYKELGIDIDRLLIEADIPQYVIDMGKNPAGEIVALSYDGTGGAFIYRRSIAKDVWGTDDPEIIKNKIGPGWERFFEAAEEVKAKGYAIVSSCAEIWDMVHNSAEKPWIVDGKLYIDPKREEYFDLVRRLVKNGYTNNTDPGFEGWFDDIRGVGEKKVLGFFGPSWFINDVIRLNCDGEKTGEGSYGDWAVCEPPLGLFSGGTWVYVNKDSKHKEAISDIIEWLTLDSSENGLQYYWAKDTSEEFSTLTAVASGTVMKKVSCILDIIGNQDMYHVFDRAARLANGYNRTEYDAIISHYWCTQAQEYAQGKKSREQAIADFKIKVKNALEYYFRVSQSFDGEAIIIQ